MLEKYFYSSSRTNIVNLKIKLKPVTKKSRVNIDSYIHRIKKFLNKLVVVSVTVDSKDLKIYTMNGLLSSYNFFKTYI